ncbi:hypothetical protein Mapa_005666 [Marchantia paleacea]|nr:hypothetical protein Mapa_005666 [Marchantia paleacea]
MVASSSLYEFLDSLYYPTLYSCHLIHTKFVFSIPKDNNIVDVHFVLGIYIRISACDELVKLCDEGSPALKV